MIGTAVQPFARGRRCGLRGALLRCAAAVATVAAAATAAAAQSPGQGARGSGIEAPRFGTNLVQIGSPAEERMRLDQLLGQRPTAGFLIRSPSTLTAPLAPDSAGGIRWEVLAPQVVATWNSDLPLSLNDGAMWAGRGTSAQLLGGLRATWGRVRLVLAPELIYQENRDFEFVRSTRADRSPFAARWHPDLLGIDLPTRFGDESTTRLSPGQSSLAVDFGPVETGVATENQWWGPGIRNAIVMSNNAAGIPRIFVRTGEPIETPVGAVSGNASFGWLTESEYFDQSERNDYRTFAGLALSLSPAWVPDLTLGATRAVYRRTTKRVRFLLGPWDVLTDAGRTYGPSPERRADEIFSLFGRWVFPDDGLEAYVEWARHERPASLREFLVEPNHTQGYTVGLQWARPVGPGALRFQGELTYLEMSATNRSRFNGSYYTSVGVPQGYTQQGQVIGAATGPGSSSQWLALDYLAPSWSLGGGVGRIRWDNDAYYWTQEPVTLDHDVSALWSVRGGVRLPWARVDLEMLSGTRHNFMFQNRATAMGQDGTHDVFNRTLRLSVTPVSR